MKKLAFLLCSALLLCLFPVTAYANGPAPSRQMELTLLNPPEGTAYVDLLVPLPKDDPYYKSLANQPPAGMSATAPIVTYQEDGYCSYTFHYYGANALTPWEPSGSVHFEDYYVLEEYGKVRIAMLDSEGNILKISEKLSLAAQRMFLYTLGGYTYDCATGEWTVEQAFGTAGALAVLVYLLISFAGLVFTCLTEWLISFPFKLRRSWTILITNIVSQVFMRLLYVVLYGAVIREYWMTTLVLEVAVYIGEGIVYCLRFKDTSWKKAVAYTVVANTASLVLGLWLNYYFV